VNQFIKAYRGGDCFFVTPVRVAENKAALEGFGNSIARFEEFHQEFRTELGFEAEIGVHQVTPPQCPAVDFLTHSRNELGSKLRFDANAANVGGIVKVSGSITDIGGRHVEFLLVDDNGRVANLSSPFEADVDAGQFKIDLRLVHTSGPNRTQLFIAVVSDTPIKALQASRSQPAASVFAKALLEAQNAGQALDVNAKGIHTR
jgi:serine/threonine-protein kinase